MILMNFDDLMLVFLIFLLMLTRLQSDNTTFGDDFDDLMFLFLVLLLMLTRLQCDKKTFGYDIDDFDVCAVDVHLYCRHLFSMCGHKPNGFCTGQQL